MSTTSSSSSEIIHDFFPLIRVYKDGRIERFDGEEFIPPSLDPHTGVQSKDVQISPEHNISVRLYKPKNATPEHNLPVVVYFHGGGFLIQSAFSSLYHNYLNSLVSEANVLGISVDYRLAPEFPLPISYEDSWLALKWVANWDDAWLKEYADSSRVFLGGDSAGANIAHNMAMRIGLGNLEGLKIDGIFLTCPYFWGKEPLDDEINAVKKDFIDRDFINGIWHFSYPGTSGLDDPLLNPAMDPNISSLGCKRVLVYVFGHDALKHRGWYYKDVLEKSGWVGDVEVLEVEGELHVFHLFAPTCDNAVKMMEKIVYFLNQKNP